jgi:hypothetical protein
VVCRHEPLLKLGVLWLKRLQNTALTYREILRHGADGFTSQPLEGVPRIFIALKNPSHLTGFVPANFGFK